MMMVVEVGERGISGIREKKKKKIMKYVWTAGERKRFQPIDSTQKILQQRIIIYSAGELETIGAL